MKAEWSPEGMSHRGESHSIFARADGATAASCETTVLIPAAGRIPEGILALSNNACPAMIPVGGRPLLHWMLKYLGSLGLETYRIAVERRGLFVEDFVDCAVPAEYDVQFITPSRQGGVGFTVMELLETVETRAALVVLGDTYFQLADPAVLASVEPFVLVHPVEESYRWCVVDTDGSGHVSRFRDKEPGIDGELEALIGVYFFPDVAVARAAARATVAAADRSGGRAELAGLLQRIGETTPIRAVPAASWLDCGNPDRQAASHRALLQQREFNELAIDPTFGTITKRSRRVDKFIDEINYYRLLPPDLAVLFPRVLAFDLDYGDPWLTLEYYGYPNLAEMFVFENVDAGIWERVFAHLRDIVTTGFMRHQRPLPAGTLRQMCVAKTRARLAELRGPQALCELVAHLGPVVVNGREVANLATLWPRIEAEVAAMEGTGGGSVIHGDLCFANVLYDLRSRICKLVDPRGNFGQTGIYGDPRYDVAKLYHSVCGLYDFITNDLFHVQVEGPRLTLDIRVRDQHREILERFERVFFPAFDRREVLLITALLFASMPPLHADRPDRQLAMYANALLLLDEYLGNGSAYLGQG